MAEGTERTVVSPAVRAQQRFNDLDLPSQLSMTCLVEFVSDFRGRPIEIIETQKLNGRPICGIWIPTRKKERIYHAASRGRLHRQQLILHELSHMLLRHDLFDSTNWQGLAAFRHLSTERVNRALARGRFNTEEEVVAERLADLLAEALRDAPDEIADFQDIFE